MPGIGLNAALYSGANALAAQRVGVETAGRNIANINTPGASRQRAIIRTDISVQTGNGIQGLGAYVDQIRAVRSQYLDNQVQQQTSDKGYAETYRQLYDLVESAFGEDLTSGQVTAVQDVNAGTGLSATLERFFNAWKSLESNPSSSIFRDNVSSKTSDLITQINSNYNRVLDVKEATFTQAQIATKSINQLSAQIALLNKQIAQSEGAAVRTGEPGIDPQANDLRDNRQALIEELGKLIAIDVTYDNSATENGPLQNMASIRINNGSGTGAYLVFGRAGAGGEDTLNGNTQQTVRLDVIAADATATNSSLVGGGYDRATNSTLQIVSTTAGVAASTAALSDIAGGFTALGALPATVAASYSGTAVSTVITTGTLGGDIGAYQDHANNVIGEGHTASATGGGTIVQAYNYFTDQLQTLVDNQHIAGFDSTGAAGAQIFTYNGGAALTGPNFALLDFATASLNINDTTYNRQGFAAASTATASLDGSNANAISNLRNNAGTIQAYRDLLTKVGADGSTADRNEAQINLILTQTLGQRDAVSGISMDEELTNLQVYQRAYDASARFISVVDQMLDRIINRTI